MDMKILYALESIRTPFLDSLFSLVTRLGEETVAIVVICGLYWCLNKNLAYKTALVYFFSGLTVQGMKITCRVPRPWVRDPAFTIVESAREAATGYSFPSGHTQSGTALFAMLGLNARKGWLRALCFAAVAGVAFSRNYLGVHYPSDVAFSLVLCAVLCWAVTALMEKASDYRNFDLVMSLVMVAGAAFLWIYGVALYNKGVIDLHYVEGCCKSAGAAMGFAVGFYVERRYIQFDEKAAKPLVQVLKFVIGIAGVLAIKGGLKPILGETPTADAVRYCVLIVWAIALYPMLIKRFFSNGNADRAA